MGVMQPVSRTEVPCGQGRAVLKTSGRSCPGQEIRRLKHLWKFGGSALISMMVRSTRRSNQKPDTLMQDRISQS